MGIRATLIVDELVMIAILLLAPLDYLTLAFKRLTLSEELTKPTLFIAHGRSDISCSQICRNQGALGHCCSELTLHQSVASLWRFFLPCDSR